MTSPEILSHQVEGEGDPVLLLNGGMMTFGSWEPVAARLRLRYQVVRCDLRGQLLSPGAAPRELTGHVEDIVRLLDHLDLARVHVIGTSFGAEVGILFAALHPERAHSLAAITATDHATATICRGVERLRRSLSERLQGENPGRFYDILIDDIYSPAWAAQHRDRLAAMRAQAASLPQAWFQGVEGILACTEKLDLRPFLDRVRCPSLVIIAGQDRVMPPARSRALAAALGAEVREFPDRGHAFVVEDPEGLAEVCLGFLQRLTAPGMPKRS